jgi:hypothetical protein
MKFSTLTFLSVLFPTVTNAQVAKFAAGWANNMKSVEILKDSVGNRGIFPEKLATIKSAQHKELLIGLSGVINLFTMTEAKAKGKTADDAAAITVTSIADSSVAVTVRYISSGQGIDGNTLCNGGVGDVAYPGAVTFSSRTQELSVTNNLYLEDSEEELTVALEGSIDVMLKLTTTAAHHFNFIAVDLPSDKYDIWACWDAKVDGSLTDGQDGSFDARAAIQKRMLTVQQVRAVKTDDDIELGNGSIRRA